MSVFCGIKNANHEESNKQAAAADDDDDDRVVWYVVAVGSKMGRVKTLATG